LIISHSKATQLKPKQEKILEGALEVFLQQGYERASMDQVALTAGVSKSTIYSHFRDKEGLFKALIIRLTTQRFQIVFGDNALTGDPEVVLRHIAETILNNVDEKYLSFMRLLVGESARFPDLAQLFVCNLPKKSLEALVTYFNQHQELGIVTPEATARIFLNSIIGFIFSQEILHGKEIIPFDKNQLIDTLIALIAKKS